VKIRYSARALEQLERIHSYIAGHNPKAAKAVAHRIKRSIELLARFPYVHRQTSMPRIRVLPVIRYPYLVFYTVDEGAQEVIVLRIRHSSQDPNKQLC
jgi:addiction module RelE/StbE family toxin